MKARELVEILTDGDPEAEVIMSLDEEGNSYATIDYVSEGVWNRETDDVVDDEDKGIPAVVLFPL